MTMADTREKEISNKFLVMFSANTSNDVSVKAGDEILASMSYSSRVIALDVYQNITSVKDARNFIEIVNNGENSNLVTDVNKGNRLQRIMEVKT